MRVAQVAHIKMRAIHVTKAGLALVKTTSGKGGGGYSQDMTNNRFTTMTGGRAAVRHGMPAPGVRVMRAAAMLTAA